MTEKAVTALVVRDEAGELYVLTDRILAASRATEAQRAAIEEALGDVQGFFTPVPIPSAQPIGLAATFQLSAVRLVLPQTTLAEARPAIGPRPGV